MFQHITLRHPPVVQPILDLLSKQLLLRAQLCPRVLSHTRADDESGRLATLLPHPGQLPKTSSCIPAHSAVVGFQCDRCPWWGPTHASGDAWVVLPRVQGLRQRQPTFPCHGRISPLPINLHRITGQSHHIH